jgi:hypothetical protein
MMNRDDLRFDPPPDPRLQAALRDLEGDAPHEQVDWQALRGAISARAEMPLARRRRVRRTAARGWMRPLIPAAAAAGLATLVLLGTRGDDPASLGETAVRGAVPVEFVSAEEALRADLSDDEFVVLVSGLGDHDALLSLAVEAP